MPATLHSNYSNNQKHHAKHPKPLQRSDSEHSRYVEMLLQQDDIPTSHTIMAAAFVWLLLAGFLVFPGTFTSIKKSIEAKEHDGMEWEDKAREFVLKSVKNIPLLAVGVAMCAVSAIGMISLTFRHRKNYVWLVNKIFFPGMTNSLAGLVSTLIGVYTQHKGTWSITAKVTVMVEGGSLVVCGVLFLVFQLSLLRRVKQRHDQHYQEWPQQRSLHFYCVEKN